MKVYKNWGCFINKHVHVHSHQRHNCHFISDDSKLLYSIIETDPERGYEMISVLIDFCDDNINFSDSEVIKVGNLEYSLSIDSDRCVKFELI